MVPLMDEDCSPGSDFGFHGSKEISGSKWQAHHLAEVELERADCYEDGDEGDDVDVDDDDDEEETETRFLAIARARYERETPGAPSDEGSNRSWHPNPSWQLSPSVERMKLRAAFFDLWFANNNWPTLLPSFSYATYMAHRSRAVSHAIDAACLVQVGQATNDRRLLHEAEVSYGHALNRLQLEVGRPDLELIPFLTALHVLEIAEQFRSLSHDRQRWRYHARGVFYSMQAVKLSAASPDLQLLWSVNFRTFGLWDSLLRRKSLTRHKNLRRLLQRPERETREYNIIMEVPGALERSDDIVRLGKSASTTSVMDCISKLTFLEAHLHEYMRRCYLQSSGSPYRIATTASFVRLSDDLDITVFPHSYTWDSPSMIAIHLNYWLCLLALREAHLNVRESAGDRMYALEAARGSLRRLIANVDETARNLVMSLPFLLEPENGYVGGTYTMCTLQFVMPWYKRRKDSKRLEYCLALSRKVQELGLSCPWLEGENDNGVDYSVPCAPAKDDT